MDCDVLSSYLFLFTVKVCLINLVWRASERALCDRRRRHPCFLFSQSFSGPFCRVRHVSPCAGGRCERSEPPRQWTPDEVGKTIGIRLEFRVSGFVMSFVTVTGAPLVASADSTAIHTQAYL